MSKVNIQKEKVLGDIKIDHIPVLDLILICYLVLSLFITKDYFLRETFLMLLGGILLSILFKLNVPGSIFILSTAVFLSTPAIIGERNGHVPFILILGLNIYFTFLILGGKQSKLNSQARTGIRIYSIIIFFVMGWLFQLGSSHQIIGQVFYTINVCVLVILLTKMPEITKQFSQFLVLCIGFLNLLYWLNFALFRPKNQIPIHISGGLYRRDFFSYDVWSFGTITGGGHTLFLGFPRFVGITGEPGLWATMSILALGLGATVFTGKKRILVISLNLFGLLACQSSSLLVFFVFGVYVAYLWVIRKERFRFGISFLFTPVLFFIFLTFTRSLVSFKMTSGEGSSFRDRGLGVIGTNFTLADAIPKINYLSLLTSTPLIGVCFLFSLSLSVYFVLTSTDIWAIGSMATLFFSAMLSQPIQWHLGILLLQMLIVVSNRLLLSLKIR